ncbi:MAG: hypothetical protein ACTSRZ_13015 [Promethearchaeota archaeon]
MRIKRTKILLRIIIVYLIFINLNLIVMGVRSDNWHLTEFFNVGIEGITVNDHYYNVAEEFNKPVASTVDFKKGNPYPIKFYVGSCRNITQPTPITELQAVETVEGTKYYLWYKILYEFDLLAVSRATPSLISGLKTTTVKDKWLLYYYGKHRCWTDYKQDGVDLKPIPEAEFSGTTYEGPNLATIDNTFRGQVRIRMELGGNVLSFSHSNLQIGNNSFIFNGTCWTFGIPEYADTYSQAGVVEKVYFPVGNNQEPIVVAESQSSDKEDFSSTSIVPNPNSYKITEEAKQLIINARTTPVKIDLGVQQTYGYAPQAQIGTLNLYDYESHENIFGKFEPDTNLYPAPAHSCYIDIPIEMCPFISLGMYQWQYNTFQVYEGLHFVGLFKTKVCVDQFFASTKTTRSFVNYREVTNVYLRQTIRVPVYIASIYNWLPLPQEHEPPDIPLENTTLPAVGGYTSGTVNIEIITTQPPFNWFLLLIFVVVIVVAVIALLIFIQFRRLTNPIHMIKTLKDMGVLETLIKGKQSLVAENIDYVMVSESKELKYYKIFIFALICLAIITIFIILL